MAQATIDQEIEFFKGYKYILSNFYHSQLIIDGVTYNCAEKAYQMKKASFCGDQEVFTRLKTCINAKECKEIGKRVTETAEWLYQRVDVMRQILKAKSEQCTTYRKKLLNCKGSIVEAVPGELFWSAGLDEDDLRKTPRERWPGQNVLGQLHMELRDELQEYLMTQSQSKKRTSEYNEFVGKKRPKTNHSIESNRPAQPTNYFETPSLSPLINNDNMMFISPISSPVTAVEDDAVEKFLQSVAAEIDERLATQQKDKSKCYLHILSK